MKKADHKDNPLINPPTLPHGVAAFDKIKTAHYMPAIEYGIEKTKDDIEAIKNNPDSPTFENTIEALEFADEDLSRIIQIYSNMTSSNGSDELRKISESVSQKLSAHSNDVGMDDVLFARIEAVYKMRGTLSLNSEQMMLLEDAYKGFVRSGALLNAQDKQTLRDINEKLSQLSTTFRNNTVKSIETYQKVIDDEALLDGVPQRTKKIYAEMAEEQGMTGKWLIVMAPFPTDILGYATNRALRREIHEAMNSIACSGPYDNRQNVLEIAKLRHQRAQLLGYDAHADFVLENRMAKNPKTVKDFLQKNLTTYKPAAEDFLKDIKEFAEKTDGLTDFQPWDLSYYSRKLKEQTFSIDFEELKKYFSLENVIDGLNRHAEKLFNIEIKEAPKGKYPVWQPDVRTFELFDKATGDQISVFYGDYYAKPGVKVGGAHSHAFRGYNFFNGKADIPLVKNHCNFDRPTKKQPSLLSLSDVITLFHEFGHALHDMLGKGTYPSQIGTNVKWDFVELPSQLMENWAMQKEVLDTFAKHYETDDPIPASLVQKIKDMGNFGAGYAGLRQTSFGLLDMEWHAKDPSAIQDVAEVENKINKVAGLFNQNAQSGLRSPGFGHLFAGGYSAGYYSYKWAEVLEADIFEDFKDDLYNRAKGDRLRSEIYARGSTRDEMESFKAMKGRAPDPDALFRREGLLSDDKGKDGSSTPKPGGPS